MASAFPAKETSGFYAGLAARHGPIERVEGPSDGGFQGWLAFRLSCQRGELIMSLALGGDDRISGIHFKPARGRSPNIGSAVREIFNWPRLALIVPFFLAGLLYSWLLQKTTKRAVGISPAGIHLHKGQQFFPWDEITEVRPLRVLNIRSLWLIKKSGEKTIMPWSSLERHSDLIAAIENCAPAAHPLRKHLALLKP